MLEKYKDTWLLSLRFCARDGAASISLTDSAMHQYA